MSRRQGSVFHPTFKDRQGNTAKAKTWWIACRDRNGRRHRRVVRDAASITLADLRRLVALDYSARDLRLRGRRDPGWKRRLDAETGSFSERRPARVTQAGAGSRSCARRCART